MSVSSFFLFTLFRSLLAHLLTSRISLLVAPPPSASGSPTPSTEVVIHLDVVLLAAVVFRSHVRIAGGQDSLKKVQRIQGSTPTHFELWKGTSIVPAQEVLQEVHAAVASAEAVNTVMSCWSEFDHPDKHAELATKAGETLTELSEQLKQRTVDTFKQDRPPEAQVWRLSTCLNFQSRLVE